MDDKDLRAAMPETAPALPAVPDPQDFSRAPEREVFSWLEREGIAFRTVEHPPTHTVAESRLIKTDVEGAHTKNLFMKDKRGQLVLISAHHDTALPLNQLHKAIGTQRLSFTGAELLWSALRATPGSVSAFGLIHDQARQVCFILDQALAAFDVINFHPLRNDMTTSLSFADFLKFVASTGRQAEQIDFSAL